MRICVDAGHGGKDPGAMSFDNLVSEASLTLMMAVKLAEKLRDKGHKVLLTRSDDTYPTLTARCKTANDFNADYFISIHCNSADSQKATGIETLVYACPSHACDLANYVQKNLIAATGARDRGVKIRKDLTVLKRTAMPVILVETGFISNPQDFKQLVTYNYQDKIVTAIAQVF